MTPPRRLALLILIILLAGAGAAPAHAGEYQVRACTQPAPDVNNSWYALSTHGGMVAAAHCPSLTALPWQEGLVATHAPPFTKGATVPQGVYAAMVFKAPLGTSLKSIDYVHRFCGGSGFEAGLVNAAGTWIHKSAQSCNSLNNTQTLGLSGTAAVMLMTKCVIGPCKVPDAGVAYAAMHNVSVHVTDNTKPTITLTGGSALTPGWKRGSIDVAYRATDNTGIGYVDIRAGGQPGAASRSACDFTRLVPCPTRTGRLTVNTRAIADGMESFALVAQDAAGNLATRSFAVGVDNTPPGAPIRARLADADGWHQRNSFSLAWSSPPQPGTAPIAGAQYAICPVTLTPGDWTGCTFGQVTTTNITSIAGVTVPHAGEWDLRLWLRDAAGNESRDNAQSVRLRLDDVAPTVSFATMDSADPTRIDVLAADATSGLGRAEIEIRRRGDARWLPIRASRASFGFVGRLDDEHLRDGVYELRARIFDNAGNERSTTVDNYGRGASRAVPARIDTRLSAGPRTRTVGYGNTTRIDGRVTMAGSNPVPNATVEVWEHISLPGSVWRRVALTNADSGGRFTFNASRGPSRHLRFRYIGTPLVRARTTEIAIEVKAMTQFRTNRRRVVNGEEIVLGGRVLGAPLPRVGKIVQLQAYARGRWITFATPRASARTGRWSYRYRFTSTRGTVRYRFRARVPRESGFPYAAGVSRQARVVVRGL